MQHDPWTPTISQISTAGERPILAALDMLLELASRSLMAEHASLADGARRGPAAEPPPPCEAMATSIILLARSLRETVGCYLEALEHVYGDCETATDDDLPF